MLGEEVGQLAGLIVAPSSPVVFTGLKSAALILVVVNLLLLGSPAKKLYAGSNKRLKRLRHLSKAVDEEARVEEHRITHRTLSSLRMESTMAPVLPYHGLN